VKGDIGCFSFKICNLKGEVKFVNKILDNPFRVNYTFFLCLK